jgi:plastocyanin
MNEDIVGSGVSRRSALKTAGAVGLLSLTGIPGTVAAEREDKSYGAGNGIGAFLNEETELKDTPIWTGGIADMRGMADVEVLNGVTTEIRPTSPPFAPDITITEAPFAYDPLVVRVSPGATVKWVWSDDLLVLVPGQVEIPIPHNVVSVDVDENGDPLFENPETGTDETGNPTNVVFAPTEYEYTFAKPGNYLYYCTPHGGLDSNLAGMRGVVKVGGKPL